MSSDKYVIILYVMLTTILHSLYPQLYPPPTDN